MNKNILLVKGITSDNKWKYVMANKENNEYYFVDNKNNATEFISVEIYIAEENIKKLVSDNGRNPNFIEFKRKKI